MNRAIEDFFEEWVIDSKINPKFNIVNYYLEEKEECISTRLAQSLGLGKYKTITTLHVVTDLPGYMIGRGGILINQYTEILKLYGIDNILIHEVISANYIRRSIDQKLMSRKL